MQGRTWRNVKVSVAEKIRKYLLESGGFQEEVKNPHEAWRVKFSDSTFTYYKNGTLYSTPSNSRDPAVFEAWRWIDSLVGSRYVLPSKRERKRIIEDLGETFASLLGALPLGEAIVKSATGFEVPGQVTHVKFKKVLEPSSVKYGLEERFKPLPTEVA